MTPFLQQPLTVADLLERLGDIAASRIRLHPAPGTASEADLIRVHDHDGRICELVDCVLVEKAMGFFESRLAAVLIHLFETFLERKPLGIVVGADGMMRLAPGLVRVPDVSFVSWSRLPGRRVPRTPIPDLAPDLAVEVLSAGNTQAEMKRKVGEYFAADVRLVWLVHTRSRSVQVFKSPGRSAQRGEGETLSGGSVLPGFSLTVGEWFERAEKEPPRA